jgi:hypothetical protein
VVRDALSLDIKPLKPANTPHPRASRINICFYLQKQFPIAPHAPFSEQSAKVSEL